MDLGQEWDVKDFSLKGATEFLDDIETFGWGFTIKDYVWGNEGHGIDGLKPTAR